MSAHLGLRGTGDWSEDERPKSWREAILHLYPNGDMPLTAITARIPSESTTDPEFSWWTKTLPAQAGAITNIYTDAAMANAYVSGGVDGSVLYVKVAEAVADEFRVDHSVVLRCTSDYRVDVFGKVMAVTKNGANSQIAVKLLEADDNSPSHDLSDADRILSAGGQQPEGAPMPEAVAYNPTKFTNYCGIEETPLDITRTAKKTRLRTGDAYKEAKREALELHGIGLEKKFIWSIPTEKVGSNGKPERTTGGLLHFIKTYASGNVNDFTLNTDYSGNTWVQGGEDWLDAYLEVIFRYGSDEKLALCGSAALLGIQKLAKTYGNIQLTPTSGEYGIKVMQWITPFGVLNLKRHPLFSYEATNRGSMLILEVPKLRYRYVDDTFFKKDTSEREGGVSSVDGTKESYLTESGLEVHHPSCFGYLNGVGSDNELS